MENRRGPDDESAPTTWHIVLRSIALAALALSIGIAASWLVDPRHPGHPGAHSPR